MASKSHEVRGIIQSINDTCRKAGKPYTSYSCKSVSWDDAQRGLEGGFLSCWGGNITDTRLWAKDETLLYTVRPDNWNEKLGKVSADMVALRVGNHLGGRNNEMRTISLKQFLQNIGTYGNYAKIQQNTNFFDENLDKEVSIRFQTTFLPVSQDKQSTIEFATEAYNYNTLSDDDPKNLLLLCTTQGTAVQQDGKGAKKLFHHCLDKNTNVIHRHWLEAERTEHEVGGSQEETVEEREDAIARGKATSEIIGLESMESRFNVLMTVQIPLEQTKTESLVVADFVDSGLSDKKKKLKKRSFGMEKVKSVMFPSSKKSASENSSFSVDDLDHSFDRTLVGTANAARVSLGSKHDTWRGLTTSSPIRHPSEHVTVTVVLYNTVAGGVPSSEDTMAAIDDMEALYDSCTWSGRLADDGAGFMKKELTFEDTERITKKITTQPPARSH